ncbi:PQQ-binding-like beta-propeller repeat protein [Streptomyces sp. NPDC056503]|uniref:outer membrane protein assembly factor BamB family protein n=1 Tax=Streptomyces sp. NPDC056503 TaxID=3345842 RepID=UPI0036B226B7
MRNLRRTVGAAAILPAGTALGAALVLLAGFVYQVVAGDASGAMAAWALGLLVLAVVLLGVFGAMLPDEGAETAVAPDGPGGPGGAPVKPAPGEPGEPSPDRPGAAPSGDWFDDWFDVLTFCLVLLGLVAGGPVGIAGYEALRPRTAAAAPPSPSPPVSPSVSPSASPRPPGEASVAWTVPPVGGPYDTAPGAWGLGDAVVHVRLDGLWAYAVRDGAVRWSVPAPPREAVCAMSPSTGGPIGLVAFGRHEKPCATLVAVHTSTGKVLWRQPVRGAGLAAYGLAAGGSTAVAAEDRVVRGRSAETGEERWRRPLAPDCAIRPLLLPATGVHVIVNRVASAPQPAVLALR